MKASRVFLKRCDLKMFIEKVFSFISTSAHDLDHSAPSPACRNPARSTYHHCNTCQFLSKYFNLSTFCRCLIVKWRFNFKGVNVSIYIDTIIKKYSHKLYGVFEKSINLKSFTTHLFSL